jgi:hypothetical protein
MLTTNQNEDGAAEEEEDEANEAFVIMLIDGTATLFLDDYVKEGSEGGRRAAQDLLQALSNFVQGKSFCIEDCTIEWEIYADVKRLAALYAQNRVIDQPQVFLDFVQGFNAFDSEKGELLDLGCKTEENIAGASDLLPLDTSANENASHIRVLSWRCSLPTTHIRRT